MAGNGSRDKMKGKAKEMTGKVTGDARIKREGRTDQAKGKAKNAMDDAKENIRGIKDSLKGKDAS
ncbi:CsbD family protein [Streptomyces inhibens]|uniref:CsbD family protein n=1 Tax=Streptomyces inhibens TaxID=2293571 RepID=UPI001EE6FF7E|nr:CsbD family protein [Streptomyces inhibens]UKY48834.1 CsbD family protein [Streptomyces inhibens]